MRWEGMMNRAPSAVTWRAALAAMLGTAAAYGVSWLLPRVYQAESSLVVLPGPTVASSIGIGSGLDYIRATPTMEGLTSMDVADYLSHLLRSRALAQQVADELNLASNRQFCPRPVSKERLTKRLRRAVKVGEDMGLVSVRVRTRSPALSASIANCLLDKMGSMVHSHSRLRRTFVEGQLAQRRHELALAEDALRDFQETHRSIALTREAEEQVSALVELTTQRETARIGLAENTAGVAVVGSIPDLVRLRAEKEVLQARQRGLAEAIARVQARLAVLPEQALTLARLTEEVRVKQALVELLVKQWESAKIAEREEQDKYQIVDPAVPPEKPVFPNKLLNALLGGLAAGAAAFSFARRWDATPYASGRLVEPSNEPAPSALAQMSAYSQHEHPA